MQNNVLLDILDQNKKKFAHLEKRFTQQLISAIEVLNKQSRDAGQSGYFRRNRNQVLNQHKLTDTERSEYASLISTYFSHQSKKVRKLRSSAKEKKEGQKPDSTHKMQCGKINTVSGQFEMQF